MKKYLVIATGLFAVAATTCMAQPSANASLTIQGTVGAANSITITPLAGYNTLDIVNGVTAQNVANVTERSNDKSGYTVTMTSLNAGASGNSLFLADTALGPDTVPYSLTYNGVAVAFSAGTATLTSTATRTIGPGVTKPLAVTIASSFVAASTYADTLTLTITGK